MLYRSVVVLRNLVLETGGFTLFERISPPRCRSLLVVGSTVRGTVLRCCLGSLLLRGRKLLMHMLLRRSLLLHTLLSTCTRWWRRCLRRWSVSYCVFFLFEFFVFVVILFLIALLFLSLIVLFLENRTFLVVRSVALRLSAKPQLPRHPGLALCLV